MEKLSISDLNIVLVEPSDTQRKIISTFLTKENVKQIDSAANITEAKQLIDQHGADLIISAMYFEDGAAIELLKYVKEHESLRTIPFMLVSSENRTSKLEEFKRKGGENLAIDGGGYLTYIAPTRVNLSLTEERWPEIQFRSTREH